MEAKGCAKAAEWKDARRYFYWALRARIARSTALAKIAEASPSSTLDERAKLLDSLLPETDSHDHHAVATALETVDLSSTLAELKAAAVTRQMVELILSDRKAALEGFAKSIESLSDEEKSRLVKLIQSPSSERSPGKFAPSVAPPATLG